MTKLRQAIHNLVPRLARAAQSNVPDALMLAGAGLVSYGAWLVYPPAGFITGGVLLLVAGVLASGGGR